MNNWLGNNATALIAAITAIVVAFIGFTQWAITARQAQVRDQKDREDARLKEEKAQVRDLEDRKDARTKQTDERFQNVVDGLGSDKEQTRVGAAILLNLFLGDDYERYHQQIFELAVTYLQLQPVQLQPNSDPPSALSHALTTAFVHSLQLLRKKNFERGGTLYQSLDARSIHLDSADLYQANLNSVRMSHALLRKANLEKAQLASAVLEDAQLAGADLTNANLKGAVLTGADLTNANLTNADLTNAKLFGANLTNAKLFGVNLTNAKLGVGQDLNRITYSGADLTGANPEAALSLADTDLRGVIGLKKEQLEICKAKHAIIDEVPATSPLLSPASPPPLSQSN